MIKESCLCGACQVVLVAAGLAADKVRKPTYVMKKMSAVILRARAARLAWN
jgi:hypothetical protein